MKFYAILDCGKEGYTLCVATEPWGQFVWGEPPKGQHILDIADNRNEKSLTYTWYKELPEEVKEAIMTVSVRTADNNKRYEGQIDKTEMFVPSLEEWKYVPKEVRKEIAKDGTLCCRSVSSVGSRYDFTAWSVSSEYISLTNNMNSMKLVAPAFYLDSNLIK